MRPPRASPTCEPVARLAAGRLLIRCRPLRTRAWTATVWLVALGALAAVHAPAGAQLQPSPLLNPCPTHHPVLRCPDLVMRRPYDLRYERVGGRIHLRAGNTILNV